MPISIIFFGSFQNYSPIVLDALATNPDFDVKAVITVPPQPQGRHLQLVENECQLYAQKHHIPFFTPESLDKLLDIDQPDFIVVAGYGKLLPDIWLKFPRHLAINIHPSLLPAYRGRFPTEWAILMNESQTGISLIKISPAFDQGEILAQHTIDINKNDTKASLYKKLFQLAASEITTLLPQIISGSIVAHPQTEPCPFYARNISKDDGYIPWAIFLTYRNNKNLDIDITPPLWQEISIFKKYNDVNPADLIDRMIRSLYPWPSVWTISPSKKRLKIISLNPTIVQIEGKTPASLSQVKNIL